MCYFGLLEWTSESYNFQGSYRGRNIAVNPLTYIRPTRVLSEKYLPFLLIRPRLASLVITRPLMVSVHYNRETRWPILFKAMQRQFNDLFDPLNVTVHMEALLKVIWKNG